MPIFISLLCLIVSRSSGGSSNKPLPPNSTPLYPLNSGNSFTPTPFAPASDQAWINEVDEAIRRFDVNITEFNKKEGRTDANIHNILYYTSWWPDHLDPKSWNVGEGSWMFANCPHKNCYLTRNKRYLPHLHQYSALLFHTWKLFAKDVSVPVERSPLQKYIMFSIESFSHCAYLNPWEEKVLENFFNSTFTFRCISLYQIILAQNNSFFIISDYLCKK